MHSSACNYCLKYVQKAGTILIQMYKTHNRFAYVIAEQHACTISEVNVTLLYKQIIITNKTIIIIIIMYSTIVSVE